MPDCRPPCLLLSGGVDSAMAGSLLLDAGITPTALFVDYGQPAARAEARASHLLARHLGLTHRKVQLHGLSVPPQGEIGGRNDLLIAIAQAVAPGSGVVLGVHAGTGYRDCSPEHRAAWQALFDVQHDGQVRLLTPLLHLSKGEILRLAVQAGLPLAQTHSCETSEVPCGECSSCKDRADAGAVA